MGLNERLRIDFEMNQDGDNFEPPSFEGFRVLGGPNQSISNSWINGKRSYSKTYSFFLAPLKKGVARIAFMAAESANFGLNLQIIPIGIQYESYFFPKGRALISFGKPIKVADFQDIYVRDQNKANEQLLNSISDGLKSLVIHIESKEDYDRVLETFHQKRIYRRNLSKQLTADQALVDSIEKGVDFKYQSDSRAFQFVGNLWIFLWSIVGFIPKFFVDRLVSKTTKDPHFYGTMRFAYSVFLYPIIFLILYLLIKLLLF